MIYRILIMILILITPACASADWEFQIHEHVNPMTDEITIYESLSYYSGFYVGPSFVCVGGKYKLRTHEGGLYKREGLVRIDNNKHHKVPFTAGTYELNQTIVNEMRSGEIMLYDYRDGSHPRKLSLRGFDKAYVDYMRWIGAMK